MTVDAFLAAARACHFAACMVLLSVFLFRLCVAGRARNEAGAPVRACWRLARWSLAAGFLSGLAWFWLAAASMSGSTLREALAPELLREVLFDTKFGRLWLLRGALMLVLAGILAGPAPLRDWGGAAAAAPLLCSLAWAGHAGASGHSLHLAADAIHLFAAAAWPGGLLPFALFLNVALRTGLPGAAILTRRFSSWSLASVGSLFATGIVNACFLVGSAPALFGSAYGRILLAKLALVLAMTGIGAWNLLVLKPRLGVPEKERGALASLRRNVLLELLGGAAVVAIVGMLGMTAPPGSP